MLATNNQLEQASNRRPPPTFYCNGHPLREKVAILTLNVLNDRLSLNLEIEFLVEKVASSEYEKLD